MEERNLRKERIGVVSSNKGDKTITVTVKWKEKHPNVSICKIIRFPIYIVIIYKTD